MEFERIGKNTIQCHMTVEEMNEYGLRIEDFFTNQEKSRDFLEQLVERAEEEVGYEVESDMISMQLMRLPDDSLMITFSDKSEDSIHNMLSQLQNLAEMLEEDSGRSFSDVLAEKEMASAEEEGVLGAGERIEQKEHGTTEKRKARTDRRSSQAKLFCFSSLDAVEDFAGGIPLQKSVPSRLYKDVKTNHYYLFIKKGKLRMEEYQMLCETIIEYADHQVKQPFAEQYCKEHFKCMIAKHALKTLQDYLS